MPRSAPFVALPLLALACAPADAGSDRLVERFDSAGVEQVRNLAPDRALAWTFARRLTLGGVDEGPQAFASLGADGVSTDGAGNIHVADAGNHRIRVFDGEGRLLREMGGRGGGPGEFQFAAGFVATPDGTSLLVDMLRPGIIGYDAAGRALPLVSLEGISSGRLRWVGGATALVVTLPRDAATDSVREHLRIAGPADTVIVARAPAVANPPMIQLPNCAIAVRIPPLLSPKTIWDAAGGRLVVNDHVDYGVDVWLGDEGGTGWHLARRVSRALPRIPATVEIAAGEYPDSFRMRGGPYRCAYGPVETAEIFGFAEIAPHVKQLALSPEGMLWVRRRTSDSAATRVDVFDTTGVYLGTLPPDAPFPVAFRGTDEILTIEKDALDRPLVVVWRITRG